MIRLPELPDDWTLARCDWPSPKLRGELVAVSPCGLWYRALEPTGRGTYKLLSRAPVTMAMQLKPEEAT